MALLIVDVEADHGRTGHINNLYNTTFWALIQMGGLDAKGAEKELAVSFKQPLLIFAGEDG